MNITLAQPGSSRTNLNHSNRSDYTDKVRYAPFCCLKQQSRFQRILPDRRLARSCNRRQKEIQNRRERPPPQWSCSPIANALRIMNPFGRIHLRGQRWLSRDTVAHACATCRVATSASASASGGQNLVTRADQTGGRAAGKRAQCQTVRYRRGSSKGGGRA